MKKMNYKLKALIAVILVMLVLMGSTVSAYTVVEPDGSYCMDKVGVISESTKNYIADRNRNLETNCSGAQMCVVVLDSIGYADIEEYAYDLFNTWKIGRSGEDNGVLILMLIGDQNYWIMPGTGLERILTTDVLSGVIDVYCEPSFAAGDYDTAVKKTFSRLNELICGEYGKNPNGTGSGSGGFIGGGSTQPYNGSGSVPPSSSCSDIHLPNYYSCRSCGACSACNACNACTACAACSLACGGCGSCTGLGSIILIVIAVYVVMQVLRGMGKGRVYRSSGARPHVYRTSGPGYTSGPRPGAGRPGYTGGRPAGSYGGGSSHSSSSGSGRTGFGGFSGGGGGARTGGGSGRTGGFGGGAGGSRGGGAGRR